MLLDIVILPPLTLRRRIGRKIKTAVSGISTQYLVDNSKLIPHLSLFHVRTSATGFGKAAAIVSELAKKYSAVAIRSLGFVVENRGDTFWFSLSGRKELSGLNRAIVKRCHVLRTGPMPWTSRRKPAPSERRNRLRYGTQHNIGPTFQPHLTMGKLDRRSAPRF